VAVEERTAEAAWQATATAAWDRFVLRQAWNGQYATGLVNGRKPVCTPFRRVNNSGDYLGRQNYVSGGSDQVQGVVRSSAVGAWKLFAGHVQATNDGTGIPSSTCNVKYVYDSSDYVTFKRNQAINRTYNDLSFGGDQANRLSKRMASRAPILK
jgi:hypothetical protein